MSKVVVAVLGALALAGCASESKQTTSHLAESMAAVRGAETAGAARVPQAALHLKLAQEQIAQAQKLVGEDDERSDALAVRAYNDADLALALAREAESKRRLLSFAEAHPSLASEASSSTDSVGAGTLRSQPTNPGAVKP
jgi:hypothetical protein